MSNLSVDHLLGIKYLNKSDIDLIFKTADNFKKIINQPIKKVPSLRDITIANLFFEDSTRTKLSFELAEKRLSADVINFSSASSSVKKGETLLDTVNNILAMKVDIIVMRHPNPGASVFLSRNVNAKIVNAGDGTHEHPTQALLDAYSIREKYGVVAGKKIVIIGDILDDEGKKVANEIKDQGGSAVYVRLDVQNEADWNNAVNLAIKTYGKLDILVNNAAILTLSTIEETTKEEWDKVMDINMWGTVLGTKAVLPQMRKSGGGSIVNISSLSAMIAQPWAAAYHASKGAVRIHTKEAALEFAKDNIRVNSIHPGAIDTDMIRDAYGVERVSEYLQLIPLGRMGTSEDIAKGVMFLASDDSSYITGAELTIDGGILIK